MHYTQLGRTGLRVSRFCLGTMNFGPEADEAASHRIMDRALEQGINFFDTANVYGRSIRLGLTEEIIGRWLAQGGGRRERVVLATKVYNPMGDWPNQGRLSALHIRRACDESLVRLQTDHLDLYQMHHIARECPWEEVWQAMELLVAQGKVVYIGSSNFAGWHLAQAQEAARRRNFLGLVSEQTRYNLNTRTAELEVLPACAAYGLGFLPYSPLAGGLLAGVLQGASEGRRASDRIRRVTETYRSRLEGYEDLCAELGETPADVALAWLLQNPIVTAPILGPRTEAQLDGSLRALQFRLEAGALARLETLFPGPGGPAPEAYAW